MRPRVEPTPAIHVEGRARRSETRFASAGAHVLTLSTAIGDLGVQLHSTYVGHPDAETQIAELLIEPRSGATTSNRTAVAGELPVSFARGLCLYDHLHALRDKLEEMGFEDVLIDVPEPASASIER